MITARKSLEVRVLTFDEAWELSSSFDATESGSSPCPPSNQLESTGRDRVSSRQVGVDKQSNLRTSGNLLPCSGDPDYS